MKRFIIPVIICLTVFTSYGQGLINTGDKIPNYHFTKLVNAPGKDLTTTNLKGKPFVLALWGTWCSPCIPEMINLGKLQKQFGDNVQIIGVSNDDEQKLTYFLQKNPSQIWFASDPSDNIWNLFDIHEAGKAILVDKEGNVASITETHFIDSAAIKKLIDQKPTGLTQTKGNKMLANNEDPVLLDSSTMYSFVMQPRRAGIMPMQKRTRQGTFANRRISFVNLRPAIILKEAFDISIPEKICYATKEDSILSFKDPLCIDFIVSDSDKSNLNTLLQKELNDHLPVKGEKQKKVIPCYVLKPIAGKQLSIKEAVDSSNTFSSNGLSFSGEGIPVKTFISYLENELSYPVYDATNMTKHYNIEFSKNNIDPVQSTKDSLKKLGLELVKDEKEMEVLMISGR